MIDWIMLLCKSTGDYLSLPPAAAASCEFGEPHASLHSTQAGEKFMVWLRPLLVLHSLNWKWLQPWQQVFLQFKEHCGGWHGASQTLGRLLQLVVNQSKPLCHLIWIIWIALLSSPSLLFPRSRAQWRLQECHSAQFENQCNNTLNRSHWKLHF